MGQLVILRNQKDFAAFKASKSYQSKVLKIRVHHSLNQNIPRFGFIVPKKVLPKAVDRNLLKRRIKAILSRIHKDLKPADILIYPQATLLRKTFAQISEEIKNLISAAKLWKQLK